MFTWQYLAYTAVPLGYIGSRKLPNETAVLAALQNNIAENSGLYFFLDACLGTNPPQKKAEASNDLAKKMARYPSGVLIYTAAGSRTAEMSHWLLVDFLTELPQALLVVFS